MVQKQKTFFANHPSSPTYFIPSLAYPFHTYITSHTMAEKQKNSIQSKDVDINHGSSSSSSPRMMTWTDFAKNYREEHKCTYTEALAAAGGSSGPWKKYQDKFMKDHPTYNPKAILLQMRKERERKIAEGALPIPKSQSRKLKAKVSSVSVPSPSTSSPPPSSNDDDFDEIVTTTTIKKRKRAPSSQNNIINSEVASPPKKNKRKRTTPVKKEPTTSSYEIATKNKSSNDDPPPLTVKTPGKPLPLPSILIRKKKSTKKEVTSVNESNQPPAAPSKAPPPSSAISLAQDFEEDFLQEMEEGEIAAVEEKDKLEQVDAKEAVEEKEIHPAATSLSSRYVEDFM